ncbi:membrane protein YqaA with SNARE-associated domain [Rhodobacter viridis]|uniref:Membrane protein YqaA with SNARE-associated domain n=1 Tax=Rhodobacter viridis TaxID=1054202 RepID=A0A318U2Y8_9RHOB|nr:YqaA family protein [Rhodobacter viridis]PYF12952.1 membrane protein YqaA with SNARE-associated domain [Rhodobacter viridis]
MFDRLYRWTKGLAGHPRAEWALGIISFVESSFFPIPADVLFVPMGLARPEKIWRYALIASVTSVLGGIFGWCIGHYAFDLIARPFLEATGKIATFESLRDGAGTWAILVMLVTSGLAHMPPMKVVTILAGVLSFDPVLFILSAIVARSARFYGLGWLLSRFGAQIASFVERRLAWVAGGLLLVLAALWFVLKGA